MSLRPLLLAVVLLGVGGEAAAQDLSLPRAAAEQDWQTVRALVEAGADVNAARADGATALLWAAYWDALEVVDLLVTAGADINGADDHGVTPLERAAENASLAMVEALLGAGADPDLAQTSGLTPLMTAARTGNAAIVQALIARGASVNAATTETRSTALMWAVDEPHPEIVRVLLDAGADPHVSTTNGFTPLLYAAGNGDIETARALIAVAVDVNETGTDDTHALPYAIVLGQDDFALFLLEQGADPNGWMGGVRALHAAVGSVNAWLNDWARRHGRNASYIGNSFGRQRLPAVRRLALLQALLEHGADVNARTTTSGMFQSYIGYPKKGAFETFSCGTGDVRGATPLWVAAYAANRSDNAGIIEALLAAGADQHLTIDDGTTPFMVAAGLGRCTFRPREPRGTRSPSAEQAVRVLLAAGADINAVNEADFTALHGAAMSGLNEVIEYLVAEGADIDARDFRGRTAFRMAEGSKQSFQFQAWPETAELLQELGADTRLGLPGTVQERLRDLAVAAGGSEP